MKTFEEYLDKMGYSWNDFDRTHEMEGLIEQYADERINEALRIHDVVGRSEQLKAFIRWNNKHNGIASPVPEKMADRYLESL
jgi:hypothetical protein